MSDEQVRHLFQRIRHQLAALQTGARENWEEIGAALEDLHVMYEQMQTSLDVAEVVEKELLQQNQELAERYHYYHDLFQSLPIAYLTTNANGLILAANEAIAQLLNVPQRYLVGKPLILFVAPRDRLAFRTKLNRLFETKGIQVWQLTVYPRGGNPLPVELHVNPVRSNLSGEIETLRFVTYAIGRSQPQVIPLPQPPILQASQVEAIGRMPALPQSLDGLQVLIVDDEADAREFITYVLESSGIRVRAVASAAAALEELERFHPDVLVSDIRMPGGDGYSLIRQIRALEAQQGGHLPAAAITAYLEEDREKALTAGFEAHLHKLAQPSEWVDLVTQLAGRTAR